MIRKIHMIRSAAALVSFIGFCTYAMNLLQPYETLLRPHYNNEHRAQFYMFAETGFNAKIFPGDTGGTNILRLYECQQDALEMLNGACDTSEVGQKRVQVNANDNGVRGHFNVSGDFKLHASVCWALRCFFREDWACSIYLPLYSMELKNVIWQDQTLFITDDDIRVREFLTNDFFANVMRLGNGLDLGGWTRTGLGDLTVLAEWFHNFPQYKQLLSNVRINWRAGFVFPTGKRWDEDKIMALPFGTDGAFAIPFGVGLDLDFGRYFTAGLDVQLTYFFGNTRARRVKLTPDQTELLLLEKIQAYKEYGITQRFNLYVQGNCRGFSGLLGYQYLKHGTDVLWPTYDVVDFNIVNTAQTLQDWTIHQVFLDMQYDFRGCCDNRVRPQIGCFARLPFNGKRSFAASTIGIMASIDF